VGELAESEGVSAEGFEASVDGFGGSVGGVVVEERHDVIAAAPQGAAELGDLVEPAATPRRIESITAVIARFP
jgi:hypothetical protein